MKNSVNTLPSGVFFPTFLLVLLFVLLFLDSSYGRSQRQEREPTVATAIQAEPAINVFLNLSYHYKSVSDMFFFFGEAEAGSYFLGQSEAYANAAEYLRLLNDFQVSSRPAVGELLH